MADTIAALQRQGGAYTLETVSPHGERKLEKITSITEVIAYEPTLARVLELGADPATRIVSFTVTEAGYALDHQGELDLKHPRGRQRSRAARRCSTIYGVAAAILRARRAANAGALTFMNCDNLRHNGDHFRKNLRALHRAPRATPTCSPGWTRTRRCPNAMVDRITPRPAADMKLRVAQEAGWDDQAPLMAESFIQWVIEDRFANGRPDWEQRRRRDDRRRAAVRRGQDPHPQREPQRDRVGRHAVRLTYIHEGTRDADDPQHRRRLRHRRRDPVPARSRASPARSTCRPTATSCSTASATTPSPTPTSASPPTASPRSPASSCRRSASASARGESIASVARLPALFLAFLQRWHQGRLPFKYQDQAMVPERAHAICDAADPLAEFVADASLWGELAGSLALKDAIAAARMDLHGLLGDAAMS